jgi:phage protein U
MFAVLGEIVFEVLTSPESVRLVAAYSYAEHKVVEAPPRLQWLANELAKISLELGFHVAFSNPKAQMDALRAAGGDHQARALVFGNGVHRGYFVIETIEETQHQLADDGSYVAISARVELKEWVPGADFDPIAPARRSTPPPGIVEGPPAKAGATGGGSAATFDPSRPIGPHNLLPTSAIVQLSAAGAGPGVTYSPAAYSSPGVSAIVQRGGGPAAVVQQPQDVPPSQIVRAG